MPRFRIYKQFENVGVSTGVFVGGCLVTLFYIALAILGILGIIALIYSVID